MRQNNVSEKVAAHQGLARDVAAATSKSMTHPAPLTLHNSTFVIIMSFHRIFNIKTVVDKNIISVSFQNIFYC